MAGIRLEREEVDDLPHVCMKCGEPATHVYAKTFSWGPGWVMLLLAIGAICSGPLFLIALILIPVFLRRMLVPTPLCERHRRPWRAMRVVLYGGLGILAMMITTIVVAVLVLDRHDPRMEYVGFGALGAFAFFMAFLFTAAILQLNTIRPEEITHEDIYLTNLHKSFVQAVKDRRQARDRDGGGGRRWAD
jgi:MFS family permease